MQRHKSMAIIQAGSPKEKPNLALINKPSHYDFVEFLPWACKQYGFDVIVQSIVQERMSIMKKVKQKSLKPVAIVSTEKINTSSTSSFRRDIAYEDDNAIRVAATFDHTHSLTSIKIENNKEVPRTIFQVIDLVIKFYPSLTSLSAGTRLDAYCIHEITKILSRSSITEICLDGTYSKNPNYYILLETVSNLNCLSLAKCQINDEITKNIAENLAFSRPAAKTLRFLNLSSNRITDTGAAHLAQALKTNRHLAYLNLANNHISDAGASHIFDIMLRFSIQSEDIEQTKIRRKEYMNSINTLIHKFAAELKSTEETKSLKRKGNDKYSVGRGKNKKTEEGNLEKLAPLKLPEVKVTTHLDANQYDRAENLALQAIGPFEDIFGDLIVEDEITYCTGNNTVSCLNLAFNNLSYISLQKLIKVLNYQNDNQQTPRGLFRVRMEGNYLPTTCEEYSQIKRLLYLALEDTSTKKIKGPKKTTIKL